jgi:hypothetical protein
MFPSPTVSHQPMEKQVNPNDTDNCQQAKVMYSNPLQNKYSPFNVEEAGESGPESTANAESQSTGKCVKAEIVVIGDTIMKHIDPRKRTSKKVHKFTYPGKTAGDIEKELNSINIQSTPSHVIVHAGTNNIPTDSTEVCAKKLENLVIKTKAKFPNSKVGFSGITLRQDIEAATNIQEVNKKLKEISTKHNVAFINNSSIDNTCLNGSNLHLNSKDSAFLATHFIKFLRGEQHSRSRNRSGEDFRTSTINQVGDLLKAILAGTSRTIIQR